MKGEAGPPAAAGSFLVGRVKPCTVSPTEGVLTSQHGCDERRNQAPCIDGEVEDWEVSSPCLCLEWDRSSEKCSLSSTPSACSNSDEGTYKATGSDSASVVCGPLLSSLIQWLADPGQAFTHFLSSSTSPLGPGQKVINLSSIPFLRHVHAYYTINSCVLNICFIQYVVSSFRIA